MLWFAQKRSTGCRHAGRAWLSNRGIAAGIGTLLIGSFLAVVTGCSKRIDPRDRAAPTKETPRVGATEQLAAPAQAPQPRGPLLRVVSADELFAAVRKLNKKGTVLNVWATWCGPCREELPMLEKVAKAYAARGIAVLPLSVDEPENAPEVIELLRSIGFEPPYYLVKPPIEAMKSALYEGWPGNVPVSFLLDRSSARRYFFNAEVYEEELTPKLDALLNGSLIDGQSNFGVAEGKEL